MNVEPLQRLLDEGVALGVFPAAQATVFLDGKKVFSGAAGAVEPETLFDLSSLTKVLCTTASVMALWGEGKLGPNAQVARFFPDTPAAKAGLTLADLLCHRSGLPAFRPYFARVMPAVPELFDPSTAPSVWAEVRAEVVEAVKRTSLERGVGEAAVYSDVGFILLGEILSLAARTPLDQLFLERIARPLSLSSLAFRRVSARLAPIGKFAPTGELRPREPALGQEKLWEPFPQRRDFPATVDDDNAWVLDGVAGHAGLFGTAEDVARFGQCVLDELDGAGRIAPSALWQLAVVRDTGTPGSARALGFDTVSLPTDAQPAVSSAGTVIGRGRRGAVGHLGFTGTSLWVDLDLRLSVALVSNRVALGRANMKIREFRPRFHDGVIAALGLGGRNG